MHIPSKPLAVGDPFLKVNDTVWKFVSKKLSSAVGASRQVYQYTFERAGVLESFAEDGRPLKAYPVDPLNPKKLASDEHWLDRRLPDDIALLLDIRDKVNALDLKLGEKIVYDPATGDVGRTW